MQQIDVETAKKSELKASLKIVQSELQSLRDTVGRLLRQSSVPQTIKHASRDDDHVPAGWTERHGIEIPRAEGYF